MRVGGQRHALAALTLGKRAGDHCAGDWVGPDVGFNGCSKFIFLERRLFYREKTQTLW